MTRRYSDVKADAGKVPSVVWDFVDLATRFTYQGRSAGLELPAGFTEFLGAVPLKDASSRLDIRSGTITVGQSSFRIPDADGAITTWLKTNDSFLRGTKVVRRHGFAGVDENFGVEGFQATIWSLSDYRVDGVGAGYRLILANVLEDLSKEVFGDFDGESYNLEPLFGDVVDMTSVLTLEKSPKGIWREPGEVFIWDEDGQVGELIGYATIGGTGDKDLQTLTRKLFGIGPTGHTYIEAEAALYHAWSRRTDFATMALELATTTDRATGASVADLILNGGFEVWTTGAPNDWTEDETHGNIDEETSIVRGGGSSVKALKDTLGTGVPGLTQTTPVSAISPGKYYRFAASVYIPADSSFETAKFQIKNVPSGKFFAGDDDESDRGTWQSNTLQNILHVQASTLATSTQRIRNADLERWLSATNANAWVEITTGGSVNREEAIIVSPGARSARFDKTSAAVCGIQQSTQDNSLFPGKWHRLRMWARTSLAATVGVLYFTLEHVQGTDFLQGDFETWGASSVKHALKLDLGTKQFRENIWWFRAPDSAVRADNYRLTIANDDDATGSFYVDEISLTGPYDERDPPSITLERPTSTDVGPIGNQLDLPAGAWVIPPGKWVRLWNWILIDAGFGAADTYDIEINLGGEYPNADTVYVDDVSMVGPYDSIPNGAYDRGDGDGLGLDADYFDAWKLEELVDVELLRPYWESNALQAGAGLLFVETTPIVDVKEFIESQLLRALALFPAIDSRQRFSAEIYFSGAATQVEIDDSWDKGKFRPSSWKRNFDNRVNVLRLLSDWSPIDEAGLDREATQPTSVTRYGASKPLDINGRGFRSGLFGFPDYSAIAEATLDNWVSRILLELGNPWTELSINAFYQFRDLGLTQTVRLNVPGVPDLVLGGLGLVEKTFLVTSVAVQESTVKLGVRERRPVGRPAIVAPASQDGLTYTAATGPQRVYCALTAGNRGRFSNGDEGYTIP